MRFDENLLQSQCKKENKKAEGFQILHFYWLLSSDIMAVKRLIDIASTKVACSRHPRNSMKDVASNRRPAVTHGNVLHIESH